MARQTSVGFKKFMGSKWFFAGVLAIFIAEVVYLALTSRFPMAYDETWHLAQIQFYAQHLNPIISHQAASTYKLGSMVQNPSFLYHYLMSFPYRLIRLFTRDVVTQVIALRLINVVMAAASLIIMRKLLRLINLSEVWSNLIVLAFALTPIVTVLSAQISYDNLLILLVSLCVYQTVLVAEELDSSTFKPTRWLALLSLCLLSSLVKYAFLPIFAAIVVLIICKMVFAGRRDSVGLKLGAKANWLAANKYLKLLLISAVCLSGFLFARIYLVNLVKYHNPVPTCVEVLNSHACRQYYSYDIYYIADQQHQAGLTHATKNVARYSVYWWSLNLVDIFGTVMPQQGFYSINQNFLLIVILVGFIALCSVAVNLKRVLQTSRYLPILIFVGFIYVLILFIKNYIDYVSVGEPLAVDGRYLLPVLIYFYALLGLGLQATFAKRTTSDLDKLLLRSFLRFLRPSSLLVGSSIKLGLALAVSFAFVYFGGFNQYISKIDSNYGHLNPNDKFILSSSM